MAEETDDGEKARALRYRGNIRQRRQERREKEEAKNEELKEKERRYLKFRNARKRSVRAEFFVKPARNRRRKKSGT